MPDVSSRSGSAVWRAAASVVAAGVTAACFSPASIPQAELTAGRFVDVTCAVECGSGTVEAATFADRAVELAAAWLGVEASRVGRLHLARDEDEYAAIERRVTNGRFRTNLAFSHPASRLGVVAIQPPVGDRALADTPLPMQTLRLAAHEASHLTSYVAMPPPRRVPGWLEEGLATWIEAGTRLALGRAPADPGADPLLSTYYLRTAEAISDGRLPPIADLLRDRAGALDGGEVYAARAVLFRGLVAMDSVAVRTGVAAAVRTHRDRGSATELTTAFVDAFGGIGRIRDALDAHLASVEPMWREAGRSLDTSGGRWIQHPFASGAHAVRTRDAGAAWSLDVTVHLRGDAPVAGVTLHTPDGLWGFVRITPGEVRIVRDAPREVLATLSLDARSEREDAVDLRFRVDGTSIRVETPSGRIGPVDAGVPLSGPWGLYAWPGGWIEWEDVVSR